MEEKKPKDITKSQEPSKQIDIKEVNGRVTIVHKKAVIKGKVTQQDVLSTLLLAAKLQGEYYISKLSRGAPLEPSEVKALKELAEVAKIEVTSEPPPLPPVQEVSLKLLSSQIYQELTESKKSSE